MPTLELLFMIIISTLVVSVVLSVIDWFYLVSLSSKAALLEREVDKKALEFDALKKERAGARQTSISSASVIESSEPLTGEAPVPQQQQQSLEDTIQIVRNVRGNFERTDHFTHEIPAYQPEPPGESPQPASPIVPDVSPPAGVSVTAAAQTNMQPGVAAPLSTGSGPLGRNAPPIATNERPDMVRQMEPYVLQLYSEAKRDADFQALWHTITGVLQNCAQPQIMVDLAGINFMYDKEMDYLEKIKYLLADRGGSLRFINCDRELLTLLNNRPQLGSIVQ